MVFMLLYVHCLSSLPFVCFLLYVCCCRVPFVLLLSTIEISPVGAPQSRNAIRPTKNRPKTRKEERKKNIPNQPYQPTAKRTETRELTRSIDLNRIVPAAPVSSTDSFHFHHHG